MAKIEDIDAPSILGITDQQLNLLKTVYKLSSKNKAATPKEIELTYAKDFGGGIQKSNLFRQMKILQDKDFLTREGEANYKLNLEGLKKTLDQRKTEYQQKITHYEQLSNELEEYFKQATARPEQPIVEYFENKYFSLRMLKCLEKATTYYSTTSFPNITYGYGISENIDRREYVDVLNRRALISKNLSLYYLTDFNVDYLYNHVSKSLSDPEKCYRQCWALIDQLEEIVEKYDNIKIGYQSTHLFLDLHLPEAHEPIEYFSHVRGERSELLGVLYIRSPQISKQSKELFLSLFERAERVKGDNTKKILNKVKKELGGKYGKQDEKD